MKLDQVIKDALAAVKSNKVDEAKKLVADAFAAVKAKKDASPSETASAVIELLTLAQKTGNEILIEAALTAAGGMMNATPEPEPMVEESAATPAALPAAPAGFDAAEAVKLRAELDAVKVEMKRNLDEAPGKNAARVDFITRARAVCPDVKATDADDAIMRTVVLFVQPERKDLADKVKLHGAGYLVAAFDAALELRAARDQHTGALSLAAFRATEDGADGDDVDKLHAEMIAKRDAAWKPAKKSA